ncbi:hypothetical protein SSS_08186 [Sarcoptes scabiei]|uniref:Homeotic empty spiracles -like protein n=1 Tax=Sarcoptes scabiei TaxID=52283 RepID=A0A834VCI0_SARSC|nr:hypothetical protein SSS_08186 [Sarcoptes scabiei]
MMPLAPQLSVPNFGQLSTSPKLRNNEMKAFKPKLSFSIDSIVGKRKQLDLEKKLLKSSDRHPIDDQDENFDQNEEISNKSIKIKHRSKPRDAFDDHLERSSISPSHSARDIRSPDRSSSTGSFGAIIPTNETSASPDRSLSPLSLVTNSTNDNNNSNHNISLNKSVIADTQSTNPIQTMAQFLNGPNQSFNLNKSNLINKTSQSNSISHSPSSPTGSQPLIPPHQPSSQSPQVASLSHPNHPMMVAAAAAAAASSAAHQFPSIPSEYQHAAAFYPWFLRANPFAGRFPGMPFDSPLGSFLLPPFRKPKRIRTAFSPGQLLKLEQAFEKNHYVVGNERKQLANHLGLSETQVKVWFQNRRTKHKRQKQEDEESGSGSGTNDDNGGSNSKDYSDDDDEIDLEDEECESNGGNDDNSGNNGLGNLVGGASGIGPTALNSLGAELLAAGLPTGLSANQAQALKFANMHHLWYQSALNAGLIPHNDHHSSLTSSGSN